jgi:hypothetical protein
MRVGEIAVFKLAPEYGYGAGGQPPDIPVNSTLIFKVCAACHKLNHRTGHPTLAYWRGHFAKIRRQYYTRTHHRWREAFLTDRRNSVHGYIQ